MAFNQRALGGQSKASMDIAPPSEAATGTTSPGVRSSSKHLHNRRTAAPSPHARPPDSRPCPESAGRPRKAQAALHPPEHAIPLQAEGFQPGPTCVLSETEFSPSGEGGVCARQQENTVNNYS